MKASLLLETIITSGVSMEAREHGGIIDTPTKLQAIINGIGIIETGLTQMFSIAEIKDLVKRAIDHRNLSALIDITKEVASNLPGEFLQYSKDVKDMLEGFGYSTEPLYLARDKSMIKPGHATQHLPTGQVIYRLRQVYVSITNTTLTSDDRLKAVEIFISMLICNPHLQRRVIEMCLTSQVMVNHFDPLLPEGRLIRLKHVLVQMAADSMYDFEEEDKTPVVPPLQLVDDVLAEEAKYQAKPAPWLHFSGTEHLVAMKQEHGTLQEQLSVFHHLLNTKEGTPAQRFRDAIAYVHRSEHQRPLVGMLVGSTILATLEEMGDARKRAEFVSDAIHNKIFSRAAGTSIYSHPGRSQVVQVDPGTGKTKSPVAQALAIADNLQPTKVKPDVAAELQELMRIFGSQGKLIPLNKANLGKDPLSAVKAIMAQLDFGNAANEVHTSEAAERLKTALPGLFNEDGSLDVVAICNRAKGNPATPESKPIEISGGDRQLREDIIAMFQARGIECKVIDDVPNLGINEVHTYQIQVGNAIVALQHTPFNQTCQLTAIPVEGKHSMKPLNWQAPTEHVSGIWDEIREALNHHDAYWRINRFLDEAGYNTY